MAVVHLFKILGEAGLEKSTVIVFEDGQDASEELFEAEGLEMRR